MPCPGPLDVRVSDPVGRWPWSFRSPRPRRDHQRRQLRPAPAGRLPVTSPAHRTTMRRSPGLGLGSWGVCRERSEGLGGYAPGGRARRPCARCRRRRACRSPARAGRSTDVWCSRTVAPGRVAVPGWRIRRCGTEQRDDECCGQAHGVRQAPSSVGAAERKAPSAIVTATTAPASAVNTAVAFHVSAGFTGAGASRAVVPQARPPSAVPRPVIRLPGGDVRDDGPSGKYLQAPQGNGEGGV